MIASMLCRLQYSIELCESELSGCMSRSGSASPAAGLLHGLFVHQYFHQAAANPLSACWMLVRWKDAFLACWQWLCTLPAPA
jgi:hypothetical protein